jgi:riboflavin synthase
MFTGIIEAVGTLVHNQEVGGDRRLTINTGQLDLADVKLGDSIATNGVCLTVVELPGDGFVADVSQESLAHTRIADFKPGERVNLEKAMRPMDRLGGHIVTGHVDGLGVVRKKEQVARSIVYVIEAPKHLSHYLAAKGSITVDGVSLTVNKSDGAQFWLNIVPHTAEQTLIHQYKVGDQVHLEVDILARYIERMMQTQSAPDEDQGVTRSKLAEYGFLTRR